jgi:outer membrane protein OmpA-like peptidoglycan-associated protein
MNERSQSERGMVVSRWASGSLLMAALLQSACGTAVAPKELMDARSAYDRVAKTRASELAPAELDTAKQALARAEGSFQSEGDDPKTRDLAYIAERKALAAEAQAGVISAEREREAIDKDLKQSQLATIDKTKAELEVERRAKEGASAEVVRTKADLQKEQKAREEAEKRAAAAMASLAEVAKVKEEARGVVITLSGSVLFATGKSDLLPIAKEKLNEVAKALQDQGYKALLVEGHTDSRGNAQKNEELSYRRADSVRQHLIGQGVPPDKIKATGLGSGRPVADNQSEEGRANNRRVEIVVTPEK